MDRQAEQFVTEERQRALEQNVYVSARAADQQSALLRSIDRWLSRIFWLLLIVAICAAFVVRR